MDTDTLTNNQKATDILNSENEAISAEHAAWIHAEIESTLAKKASGKMTYHSLDDVMKDFGHGDAR